MSEEKYKNKNKLKPWIRPLLDYFKTIKKYNDIIEAIREKLYLSKNFNPNELFDFIDFQKNGFLTSKNIIYFLNQRNTKYEEQYIRTIIHNYDKDGDFILKKKEFLKMILPIKKKNLKEKIIYSVNEKGENKPSNDIIQNFNELIKEELKLAEASFFAIKNIYGSPNFTTYEAFIDIVKNESYITRKNLNLFLKENGLELEDDEIYLLMFRIDNDDDNRISYVEFQDIFYPLKKLEQYNDNKNLESVKIINNDFNIIDFKNKNTLDNNIYSKYYNYDYCSGYSSQNDDIYYNYNIKEKNNNKSIKNQINASDYYYNFLSKMNDNLKNKQNNNIYDSDRNFEGNNDKNLVKDNKNNDNTLNKERDSNKESIKYNINNKLENDNEFEKNNNYSKSQDNVGEKNNLNLENKLTLKNIKNENESEKNILDLEKNNKNNNINNNEEIIETLSEEIIIRDTEGKNSQGFTNSLTEKKDYNKKEYINLKRQNCFKFEIIGKNKSNKDYEKRNNYLIKNLIPVKENNYKYISSTERILNNIPKIYQNEKVIGKKDFNFNLTSVDNKYINFTVRQKNQNELNNNFDILNNYENFNNNDNIIEDSNIDSNFNDNIINGKEKLNSCITPNKKKNLPPFFNLSNYPEDAKTPIISNNNKNKIINKKTEEKAKSCRLIIKNDSLFDLLNDYITQDTITENILENLSLCQDFNLINLFQSFLNSNYLNEKILTWKDLYKTLTDMGLYVNLNDIAYIYSKFNKKFNKDNDQGFSYSDFCYMMTPKKYIMAQNLNKKENIKYFMGFSFKTKRILCSAFKQLIDAEKSNENYRNKLIGNEKNMFKIYYCIENLFNSLKKNNKKGIDKDDICDFMKTNGRKLCQFEIELLMERFDKNKDELIDINEFFNEIRPKL